MYHCNFIRVVCVSTSQEERFHRIPVTSSLISSSRALRSTLINWVIPPALAIAFCNTPITQYSEGQKMICEIILLREDNSVTALPCYLSLRALCRRRGSSRRHMHSSGLLGNRCVGVLPVEEYHPDPCQHQYFMYQNMHINTHQY